MPKIQLHALVIETSRASIIQRPGRRNDTRHRTDTNWRLERDGQTLAGEQVASRSRADFAYGAPLGAGASEVVDAIAVRIGMTLGGVPESRVISPVPLPAVATAPLNAPTTRNEQQPASTAVPPVVASPGGVGALDASKSSEATEVAPSLAKSQ